MSARCRNLVEKEKETGAPAKALPVSLGNSGVAPPIDCSIARKAHHVKAFSGANPPEALVSHLLDWAVRSTKDAIREFADGDPVGAKDLFAVALDAQRLAIDRILERS